MTYTLTDIETHPYDPDVPHVTRGWGVSVSTGSHIDGAVLNVYRVVETPHGQPPDIAHHALHGSQYATHDEANRAAYDAGLLSNYYRETV